MKSDMDIHTIHSVYHLCLPTVACVRLCLDLLCVRTIGITFMSLYFRVIRVSASAAVWLLKRRAGVVSMVTRRFVAYLPIRTRIQI